ncbi:hypothetical protein [Dictyobacter aurantiacus]|uniref:Uncharacterized protein n=1 Tax=Dictyobacter aurantiacus TaxID=1936993 RepID=A0A401ZK66_9CHLR|nr:hypothetical protein [Dictyobacter aurantiacus]GCE07222.1 hypothetical protein KDAU_45510 [Dictyobacter aurantiacus]
MKDEQSVTVFIHGGMSLLLLLVFFCSLLAFDASRHSASAATHTIQASHHIHQDDSTKPGRSRTRYHYTTHHYSSSRGSGWPFDAATSIVILVVCVVIGILFSVFKWLRQDDYNDE